MANRTDAELEKFAVELVIKKCPFIKSKKKKILILIEENVIITEKFIIYSLLNEI